MRNFKPYDGDCFVFYESVLGRKRTSPNKTLLLANLPIVSSRYDTYIDHYGKNNLELLQNHGHIVGLEDALRDLYEYDSKSIRDLREEINKAQPRAIKHICPSCTCDLHESLDHFVPQTEFSEFSVHPLNLIPSCAKCNSKKNAVWRNATGRSVLNLYTDSIPMLNFLFVDIGIDNNAEIAFTYILHEPVGVDATIWGLLKSHFTKLNLLNRMADMAGSNLARIVNSAVIARIRGLSENDIRDDMIATAERNSHDLGMNHWSVVAEKALAVSPHFWDQVSKEIQKY